MVEELIVLKDEVFRFELIQHMNIIDFFVDNFANFYIQELVPH